MVFKNINCYLAKMIMFDIWFQIQFILYIKFVQTANILGVSIIPAYSRQQILQPMWRELSLRGHQLTVLTPFPLNDPELVNLTEIDLGFTRDMIIKTNLQSAIMKNLAIKNIMDNLFKFMEKNAIAELTCPAVQKLIKNKSKTFDIMIVEFIHPTMTALSEIFHCPMIGVMTMGGYLTIHDTVGNPTHPGVYQDSFLQFSGTFQRFYNTYFAFWYRHYYNYEILQQQDKIVKTYISPDTSYLGNIEKNVSMLFLNTNPIFYLARPNVPAIVELGKMHITRNQPLPTDLQKELDAAKNGAIYFSLGSNVNSSNLPIKLREIIKNALSELPYKVLWKWEIDHLPDQPKNVITRKWFPQKAILNHSNIKVFVTQAGLHSMEESISCCVPLVAMPFFTDQPLNAKIMVKLGIAKSVDIETFTKVELKSAIVEIAENSKYRENVREVSKLLSDVPMMGVKKIIWWTEYVIRHEGAYHFRSPVVNMPWYKYFLIDVLGFVCSVTFIVIFVLQKLIVSTVKIAYTFLIRYRE